MADKWYYNSSSGSIGNWNTVTMWPALHAGIGWHGPFDSKQATLDYYEKNKANNPGWKAPTESIKTAIGNQVSSDVNNAKSVLGLSDEQISTWFLRIGEVLLGLVLVAVGVAKLTGTTNAISSAVKAKI